MAAEASRSNPSPDSYIGSLITLTSKSEIRYEGILYNINTEESSIGLRNVRSFGTEGRKKDGSQVPASDKIYEYILFRGSDIKDLQVKASPPVQATPVHNDPAIIQSHYPHPPASSLFSSSLTSPGAGATLEPTSHAGQLGLQRPTFQGLSAYPTGGNIGPWGPTPPPAANGSGLAVPPMFWQGYYGSSTNMGGLSHLQQPPLMRPLPGLVMPPMQQTLQFQGINASLPSGTPTYTEFSSLFPTVVSNQSLASSLPSTLAPIQATPFSQELSESVVNIQGPITSFPSVIPSGSFQSLAPLTTGTENTTLLPQNIPSVVSTKPRIAPITSGANQTESQSITSSLVSMSFNPPETSVKLVTPGQLVQPSPSALPSSHKLEKNSKEVEVERKDYKSKPLLPEPLVLARDAKPKLLALAKEPILPLPTAYHKPSEANFVAREYNRGRGRGSVYPPRTHNHFTEDFDFMAMNEKFNKDEVWGNLGKSRPHNEEVIADAYVEDDHPIEIDIKPVYVKDDFFDTLSCNNTSNNHTSNGRIKFSEQLKIDTETFGNFSRNRSFHRGGQGVYGGRGRGSYYGRGHGYSGRGRGHGGPGRFS